jgi:hypothetical protein
VPDKKSADVTVEQLLEIQKRETLLATLEAVPEKPNLVKVTPWFPGRGCACSSSLVVEKRSIKKLTRTGRRHFCCGKLLTVVEVEIDGKAVISLSEVFALVIRRAAAGSRLRRRRVYRKGRRVRDPVRAYFAKALPIDKTKDGDDDGGVDGGDFGGGGDDGGDDDGGDDGGVDGGDDGSDDGGTDGSANSTTSQCQQEKYDECIARFTAITKNPANQSQRDFCRLWAQDECVQPGGST